MGLSTTQVGKIYSKNGNLPSLVKYMICVNLVTISNLGSAVADTMKNIKLYYEIIVRLEYSLMLISLQNALIKSTSYFALFTDYKILISLEANN